MILSHISLIVSHTLVKSLENHSTAGVKNSLIFVHTPEKKSSIGVITVIIASFTAVNFSENHSATVE